MKLNPPRKITCLGWLDPDAVCSDCQADADRGLRQLCLSARDGSRCADASGHQAWGPVGNPSRGAALSPGDGPVLGRWGLPLLLPIDSLWNA